MSQVIAAPTTRPHNRALYCPSLKGVRHFITDLNVTKVMPAWVAQRVPASSASALCGLDVSQLLSGNRKAPETSWVSLLQKYECANAVMQLLDGSAVREARVLGARQ